MPHEAVEDGPSRSSWWERGSPGCPRHYTSRGQASASPFSSARVRSAAGSARTRCGTIPGTAVRHRQRRECADHAQLIADALAAVGESFESTSPPVTLTKLAPSYHARFADGTALNVFSDPAAMSAEVERVCGAGEAAGYRRLRRWLASIFDTEFDRYIDSNFDSPLDLVSSRGALIRHRETRSPGGFGRLGPRVGSFVRDDRLRRIFTFQALYAGMSPAKALGVYGAIAHMDTSLGVYFPEGGMCTIARAMPMPHPPRWGGVHRCRGLRGGRRRWPGYRRPDGDGRHFECDALVLTADLPVVDRLLDGAGVATRGRRRGYAVASPSAVVFHGTVPTEVTRTWPTRAHHTIDFGAQWSETFARITAPRGRGRLMYDPSLLITRPAVTDPGLHVVGTAWHSEPVSILAPCPNLDSADLGLGPAGDVVHS